MTGYVLSPRAAADLDDIWDYTVERWGRAQAEVYVQNIKVVLDALAQHPQRRRVCDDIRAGYFKASSGSHVVFYRIVAGELDIVRILHQRMDFNRHF